MEKDQLMNSSSTVAAALQDEFDDEEKKMDKFYEVIRRFKEAREDHRRTILQLRVQNQQQNHNSENNLKKIDEIKGFGSDNSNAIWMPSFKLEDFRDVNRYQQDNQDLEEDKSDKSGTNFLHRSCNCVNNNNNNNNDNNRVDNYDFMNKFGKRKVNDVDDDDDDDDEIAADQFKTKKTHRFDTGLDLNLAL